jgi:non-specific serine/threonine protein kinase
LQRELSTEPGPATRALYQSLLHQPPPMVPVEAPPQPAHHNLPYALTSFIGRERESAELNRLIIAPPAAESAARRLVTLTGAGGSGKTRLALKVAFDVEAQFPDGAWWVDLAPLSDPGMVPRAVASILGVQEQPDRALIETLASALGSRRLLLILDNCEHLVAECARLAGHLLSACANLTILATSREALGLAGEAVYPVPPLPLPMTPDIDGVERAEAVRLFVERAALALPTFALTSPNRDAVAQVCRRLDGLPLAIELAAARVKVLSAEQIAARLDDRFNLLTGGDRAALPRHQALRALVDWSYELLAGPEQALFRQLSVFAGGFTLEAAEAVGRVDAAPPDSVLENLSRLIDKSLVIAEEAAGAAMRYRMLETIRQYALEKLGQADETRWACGRHAGFFVRVAEEANQLLQGATQQAGLDRLESDRDNLRAALGWCLDSENTEMALRLGGQLGWFWVRRSDLIEGRQWLERACARPDAGRYPRAFARALVSTGILAFLQTEEKEARPWLEQALTLARAHDDQLTAADALNFLGLVCLRERDIARARACLEESQTLFQALGDSAGYARTVWHLGFVAEHEGDAAAVLAQYEQALTLLRIWGDALRQSAVLRSIGWNQYELGDRTGGRSSLRESLALVQSIGHKAGIAHTLRAIAERIEADPERAVRLLMVVIHLYHNLGSTTFESAVVEKDLALRRAQLDEPAFARACAAGRTMTMEQAVQDALLVE